jgi:hypothetical protein
MPIISERTTIYNIDGTSETLPIDQARYRVYMNPGEWSLTPPPPPNWDRELPLYRLTRDLQPAQKPRFRHEPPFSETWESDVWQYGEKFLARGTEITSIAWPHPSMRGLTFGAEKILQFYTASMKSRLPVSPWHEGRIRLDNGLSDAPGIVVRAPKLQPMNLRPVA